MSHTSASPVDAFATSDRLPVSGASSTGSSNNNINSNSTATSTSTGSSAAYPSAPDALGDSAGEHAASRSAFAEAPPGADATPPTTNTGPSSPALDLLHSHHHTDYANSPLASSRSRSLNDGLSPLPPPSHTAESSSSSSSLDAIAAMPVDPLASATQPAVTAAPIQRLLTALPVEALWRVFLATNSPKLVFNLLPRVCRRFHQTVRSFSVPMLANVDLLSEDEEDGGGANTPLLHTLEPARLLRAFRAVRVHPGCVDLADGEAAAGGRRGTTPPALSSLLLPSSPTSSPLSSSPLSGTPSPDLPLMHVAAERHIRVHISAIPDNPETLVEYVKQLLKRNAFGSHVKTPVRVVIGTVQVKGRRGNASADTVGSFLRSLRPINVTLWWWDSELIEKLQNVAMTLRLPNMRSDGHIQPRDMAVSTSSASF
ncbi:hypothetical protein DFJ73DRAFT_481034 [Zopfochytrium polystomum]|nr:hypothetical protein DFJ73DRAFT_481034 [Zopfochytrium polystomum]